MLRKIERDVKRFRQIVRGVVKKDFRKYLTQGELIGRQGRHIVSIPLPQIEIPRFRFGQKEAGGVGSGEGGRGDAVDGAPPGMAIALPPRLTAAPRGRGAGQRKNDGGREER